MRKLVLRMLTSLDGFIADAGGDVGFGSWSEELQRFYAESFNAAGGLVYGRVVYERYVPYWEAVAATGRHAGGEAATEAEVAFATRVLGLPKYVASNTLNGVSGRATVLRGADVSEQIAALKRQPGGDLLLMCGPALLSALSAEGLVDEYMLDVYPVELGHGVHLFRDLATPIGLRPVSSRSFPLGVNVRIYEPYYGAGDLQVA